MAGVGLERDVLVLLGELKLEWFCPPLVPGERDMMSWLLLPGYPWRVRAMPVAPQQGLQPALSVTILAGRTAGHFSLVGPGLAISLRNRLKKSSSIWQPAIWAPHSDSASSVLQISTVLLQYYYIHYVHYVQTLSTRLKLWFWVLFLSLIVLQDWSSSPAISFIFVA